MAPSRGAAFFDLDRTLLQGGTGPLLSQAMREAGVSKHGIPAEKLIYGFFDRVGETPESIFLARQASWLAKGKEGDAYVAAAEAAAEVIAERVHPFAHVLIDQHRREGRLVVMATTTPAHLIRPLAERLGFDDVVATEYAVTGGRFTGRITGPFVWGRGKLAAVRAFADAHDIDLGHSFAYSDSIFDAPLLGAVGHPSAVNPDPRLTAYALLRRWPIVHFDVSPGVVKIPGVGWELQRIVTTLVAPELFPYARFVISGTNYIPETGPAIIVSNHRSYLDIFAAAQMIRRTSRTARVLAKQEVFGVPVFGDILRGMGGISVDRGVGGHRATSLDLAAVALEGGELVYILPQGTIPRGEKFFEPVLHGRTGAARLALATGVPVIPMGLWGTEKVWPRSSKLPHMLALNDPPTVRVRVGRPFHLEQDTPINNTRRMLDAVSQLLPPQARRPYEPTEEELRSTYPGGRLPGEG